MSKVKAEAKWVRISPRKVSKVAELVRGKLAVTALAELALMPQKAARILGKVLKSAIANAKNNFKMAENELIVSEAYANKGIILKRWQPRAKGRMFPIHKRTSHVTVMLGARGKEAK
ncbi:MAG: 50S ribosomal protein L22 [bacterium]